MPNVKSIPAPSSAKGHGAKTAPKGGALSFLKWLDPFTYVDILLAKINPGKNPLIDWPVYFISAFLVAFVIYSAVGILLGTGSPMVIVLSESMAPTLHRGDVLLIVGTGAEGVNAKEATVDMETLKGIPLALYANALSGRLLFSNGQEIAIDKSGDMVIYFSEYRGETVIHRAVAKLKAGDGTYLITKGDNSATNSRVDQDCGIVINGLPERDCINLYAVDDSALQGKAVFMVPLIGYFKLLLVDDMQVLLFGCQRAGGCTLP